MRVHDRAVERLVGAERGAERPAARLTVWAAAELPEVRAGDDLVELVLGQGGSLKAEHGTGRIMAPFVRRQYGDELTDMMWSIKRLFDPAGILNPGVVLSDDPDSYLRDLKTAPPVEEVKVGCKILEYLGLRPRKFDIISCPSCGRAQVDVIQLANAVTEGLKDVTAPIRVAVMGCIVNGPGEAREADLGVASGNGKGQIFIKGKVIETVPEDRIVDTLLEKANEIAAQMEAEGQVPVGATGPVVVPITHTARHA